MNRPDCTLTTRWTPRTGPVPAAATAGGTLRTYADGGPADAVLVWFPYAGGTASQVAAWRDQLPAGVGLSAVQYPGRADRLREPRPAALADLAGEVADALETRDLAARAILWGHSLGALVALETVRELERRGRAPRALVVTGRRVPGRPGAFDDLAELDDDALVDALAAMDPGSGAAGLRGEARDYWLGLVRADASLAAGALAASDPERPASVTVPIVAATGSQDPAALVTDLHEWSAFSTAPVTVAHLAGGHLGAVATPDAVLAVLTDADLLPAPPGAHARTLRRDGDHT